MKRKLIQLAGKTLVVSVPSKWVKKLGLKKGQEVNLIESDNTLLVTANETLHVERARLHATKNHRLTKWTLSALHKSGFDEIEVTFDDEKDSEEVHEFVKSQFIGFAVIEQSSKKMVIRSIAEDLNSQYDSVLRRAFLVTLSMADGLCLNLRSGKITELSKMLSLEFTNNQLTNFCERILVKNGYKEFRKTCFAYVIVWQLEKICDSYKYIIEQLSASEKNTVIKPEVISTLEKSTKLFRDYYELFYKFDAEKLSELSMQAKELQKSRGEFSKLEKHDLAILEYSMMICVQCSDLSASIIALNTIA